MAEKIKDFELKEKSTVLDLVKGLAGCGFQATHLSEAVSLIEKMKKENCTIFLAFTANMVASGLRGVFRELCEKKFADAVITTAGSIDHDIIKSFQSYEKGTFQANDVKLHKKGVNRIGNIFVKNSGFELLEEKLQLWLKELFEKEQVVSPKMFCEFVGSKLNQSSFLHWCQKNKIPVFCPGITDGAIGLQMHFFKQEHKNFGVDVTKDMRDLADLVLNAEKTAGIILGGGISKHHVLGANLVRDGLDYAVYISTASEFDGSLSGAQTKEAKSWGKIQELGKSVNVVGDATVLFPIIVASLKEKGIL